MNNFGSYMLTQNPNSPGNANNVMIVAMSRSPEGHRVMTATWDGSENPKPVFFGSDEMMTLTPEETEARDTMMGALTAKDEEDARLQQLIEASRKEGMAEGRAAAFTEARLKLHATRRNWSVAAAIGWALALILCVAHLPA